MWWQRREGAGAAGAAEANGHHGPYLPIFRLFLDLTEVSASICSKTGLIGYLKQK